MVSKCANPECSQMFRYLRQGKVFRLILSPTAQATAMTLGALLSERFWLCDRCADEMTVIWDGSQAKVAPLPKETETLAVLLPSPPPKSPQRARIRPARLLAIAAGREDC